MRQSHFGCFKGSLSFGATTNTLMALALVTLSVTGKNVLLSFRLTSTFSHYGECHLLGATLIILSVIVLNVVAPSV
jgi:hypothetical protein